MTILGNTLRLMRSTIATAACAVTLGGGAAFAGSVHTDASPAAVALGTTQAIDRFGKCRNVANTENGDAVMVPVRDASEWSAGDASFLAEPREGTAVTDCAALNGWTVPTATYVTTFECPNSHKRQFCSMGFTQSFSSDDGSTILAYANNDMGINKKNPIINLMGNNNGTISVLGDQKAAIYPHAPTAYAMTSDGRFYATYESRYSSDKYWPELILYSFDGATSTRLASGKFPGTGGYVSFGMTDDAKFIDADGMILTRQGTDLVPASVTGPSIHENPKVISAIVMTVWNQANNAFYEFSAKYGIFEVTRQSDDSWVRTKIQNASGAGAGYMRITVSHDGKTIAYSSVPDWRNNKVVTIHIMRRDGNGVWAETGKADYPGEPVLGRGFFLYSLSANDGKYIVWPDKSGEVKFINTAGVEQGNIIVDGSIKPQTTTRSKYQSSLYFAPITLPSGLLLIRSWSHNTRGVIEVWKTQ